MQYARNIKYDKWRLLRRCYNCGTNLQHSNINKKTVHLFNNLPKETLKFKRVEKPCSLKRSTYANFNGESTSTDVICMDNE